MLALRTAGGGELFPGYSGLLVWIFIVCLCVRLLKTQSLEWFYNNVKKRFKRFGSAKVLKTFYRKHLAEHRALSEITGKALSSLELWLKSGMTNFFSFLIVKSREFLTCLTWHCENTTSGLHISIMCLCKHIINLICWLQMFLYICDFCCSYPQAVQNRDRIKLLLGFDFI